MRVYLYDGSWEGLLTAVHEAYYRREEPEEIAVEGSYAPGLFDAVEIIATDGEKAAKVAQAAAAKISPEALRHAYYAYLSSDPQAGTKVFRYLRLGFRVGAAVDRHLTDGRVRPVHLLSRRVRKEWRRFLGFVRFRKLAGDVYYAPIEPDHDITALLAPHFADRLADQRWVIHDVGRGVAAFYDRGQWVMAPLADLGELPLAEGERECQEQWKAFFARLAIAERKNPRLQRNHMPRRYWRNLVEEPGKENQL